MEHAVEPSQSPLAGLLGDLHVLDPSQLAWTELSKVVSGSAPAPRCGHGFASADGMLYVFGGQGVVGETLYFSC
jgi:hypothetical protein